MFTRVRVEVSKDMMSDRLAKARLFLCVLILGCVIATLLSAFLIYLDAFRIPAMACFINSGQYFHQNRTICVFPNSCLGAPSSDLHPVLCAGNSILWVCLLWKLTPDTLGTPWVTNVNWFRKPCGSQEYVLGSMPSLGPLPPWVIGLPVGHIYFLRNVLCSMNLKLTWPEGQAGEGRVFWVDSVNHAEF